MNVALLGNPNTGKSTIFNMLTGMRQHVGNFPGITVDKKFGKFIVNQVEATLIDFPGIYSLYPRSEDEKVVYNSLSDSDNDNYPDAALVIVDASNLERNLLFFSQVYDLQIPIVMVLNMSDIAKKHSIEHNIESLKVIFPEATIVQSNARVKIGKQRIVEALESVKERKGHQFIPGQIAQVDDVNGQEESARLRFEKIKKVLPSIEEKISRAESKSAKLDKILVHPIFGYLIFSLVLITMFQLIYSFATVPMDLIDGAFVVFSDWMASVLPEGVFTDLITQGLIPGIGGIAIFIPQIALLFFFIALLEESGYLSRVVFIMDRIMRPLGLNGKSMVPLLSSVACAIPGVMAARTISNWKERTITIMVAPLMSCSARIPVYTLLIALVIPNEYFMGLNVQGLVLFGLYALGTVSALLVAFILQKIMKTKNKGFLLLEMPSYKLPHWGNLMFTVFEKVKVFVFGAGKIILAISIILWAMATYGPGDRMDNSEIDANLYAQEKNYSEEKTEQYIASVRLENSFIGIMGKTIEPVIRPLGYDWKIGISLITSFAAREVFVGSMATIYAVQDDGAENRPLIEKMRNEKKRDGTPVYTLASGVSLLVFYVFAMMCMATVAVVKRETKSWKWPLIQMGYMGVLAYLGAWISFVILS